MPLSAGSLTFRCLILCFSSIATVGPNLVRESYTVLQTALTSSPNCTHSLVTSSVTGGCCSDCVGMGDEMYNLLFTMLFCTSAVSLLIFGFLMDKFGSRVMIFTCSSAFVGSCIFAGATCVSQTRAFAPLAFTGTCLLGIGYLSTVTSRSRLLSQWFTSDQIGIAFGFATGLNRVVSVVTFSLEEKVRESVGLQMTLWMTCCIALFSVVCSVCAVCLDNFGTQQLSLNEQRQSSQNSVKVTDVRHFSLEFWLLLSFYAMFSSVYNNYQDNLTEYVHQKYNMTLEIASIVSGSVRYVGILVAPASGFIVGRAGRPAWLVLIVTCVLLPFTLIQAFTQLSAVICILCIGSCFSFLYVATESSIPSTVPKANVGFALSLGMSVTTVCVGVLHAIEGAILGWELNLPLSVKLQRWQNFMSVISGVLFASLITAVAMVTVATKRSTILVAPRVDGNSSSDSYQELDD